MNPAVPLTVIVLFGALLLVSILMVITAHRGLVCSKADGYDSVPERVRSDPDLAERANAEVGRHAIYGAVLALAPIGFAGWMLLRGGSNTTPTAVLVMVAIYAGVIVVVLRLPLERMKHW